MAARIEVQFNDHASANQRRLVLSFLNALSGQTEATGESKYTFLIARPSRICRARDGLLEWERDGLIRWSEASA